MCQSHMEVSSTEQQQKGFILFLVTFSAHLIVSGDSVIIKKVSSMICLTPQSSLVYSENNCLITQWCGISGSASTNEITMSYSMQDFPGILHHNDRRRVCNALI